MRQTSQRITCLWRSELSVLLALSSLLFLGLFLLVACEAGAEVAAGELTTTETSVSPTNAEAPRPPIVTDVEATATNLPSFAPPAQVKQLETPTALPTGTSTTMPSASADAIIAATDAITTTEITAAVTAEPTFTRPASAGESSNEHYWLQRPVPQGGTVWTDKHYPYGSTRGGQLRTHHGVEFNVTYDTPIFAAGSGTVVVAGSDTETAYGPHTRFYGNLVVIEHDFQHAGQRVYTLYGHLNEVEVTVGQQVSGQDVIGRSGATGIADGPHMHFEVRVGANGYNNTRNPLLWLYPFPGRGTVAGRVIWPSGEMVTEAPISLNRVDGSSPYYATTTYADATLNPDEHWNENFAIDDVVAGFYEVIVRVGDKKYTAETWVYPYQTGFVEIVLD